MLFAVLSLYFIINGYGQKASGKDVLNKVNPIEINKGTPVRTSQLFNVHLVSNESAGCLSGDYTYCVNGGLITNASGDFQIEADCESYVTICVQSSSGCKGEWSGYVTCEFAQTITINLVPNEEGVCDCMR